MIVKIQFTIMEMCKMILMRRKYVWFYKSNRMLSLAILASAWKGKKRSHQEVGNKKTGFYL